METQNSLLSFGSLMGAKFAFGTSLWVSLASVVLAQTAGSQDLNVIADLVTSIGLGGMALVLALFMVHDSYKRRIEEAKEYAADLKQSHEAQMNLQGKMLEQEREFKREVLAMLAKERLARAGKAVE